MLMNEIKASWNAKGGAVISKEIIIIIIILNS